MNTFTKTLILLAVVFGLSANMPVQAQIGGMLNKAKGAVKKEVKETTKKETEKTVETKVEEKGAQTPVAAGASGNVQVPVDVVDTGTPDSYVGVPIGEKVYETYKNLNYDTYYGTSTLNPKFYYLSAEKSKAWLDHEAERFMDAISAGEDGVPIIVEDDKGRPVPCGEFTINAYFALYNALPSACYPMLLTARAYLKVLVDGKVDGDFTKKSVMVCKVREEGGSISSSYAPSEYAKRGYGYQEVMIYDPSDGGYGKEQRLKRWQAEEARLLNIYRQKVPFENVKATVINYIMGAINATKAKNWGNAAYLSYLLDVAVKDMMEHPKKVEDEDYKHAVQTYQTMAADNFPKWRAEVSRQWKVFYAEYAAKHGGTTAIPQAALSDPKLEGEMIAIAKGIYDDGRTPVKAIIKLREWEYDRNALNQIIDRYHTAYIIFKMKDGTHRMVDIGFKQLYNGGSYGATQLRGIGMLNETVEYP